MRKRHSFLHPTEKRQQPISSILQKTINVVHKIAEMQDPVKTNVRKIPMDVHIMQEEINKKICYISSQIFSMEKRINLLESKIHGVQLDNRRLLHEINQDKECSEEIWLSGDRYSQLLHSINAGNL